MVGFLWSYGAVQHVQAISGTVIISRFPDAISQPRAVVVKAQDTIVTCHSIIPSFQVQSAVSLQTWIQRSKQARSAK